MSWIFKIFFFKAFEKKSILIINLLTTCELLYFTLIQNKYHKFMN